MINFAHRGASGNYPENTILAFKEAINRGATGIELDIHKTKDGALVVNHDEDIKRTFCGRGFIKDYTLKELKIIKNRNEKFRENKECFIPTLEEVLEFIKDKDILLNIELKTDIINYPNIEEDTIKIIEKFKMNEKVLISSFNFNTIKRVKELGSKIRLGILYEKNIKEVFSLREEIGFDYIHPHFKLVSKRLIKEAHDNNIKVNVYTVNNKIIMKRLRNMMVDGIFTNYPEKFKNILEEGEKINF